MIPVLGEKYEIDLEVMSKPKAEYLTDDYFELDLPVAPALMVGEEIIVEGSDIGRIVVEAAICRQLGLPAPEHEEKGFLKKLFKSTSEFRQNKK